MKPNAKLTRPIHDLPCDPPPGEHVLWQGSPQWWLLAKSLHVQVFAVYFAVLLAWYAANAIGTEPPRAALLGTARMAGLAAIALFLFVAYAWMVSRSSSYTLTNRRMILQTGIALPVSFNVPFGRIGGANLKTRRDGSGDIALSLQPGEKLNYVVIWPHARPWRFARAEPMLRALPEVSRVATKLAALLEASLQAEPAVVGRAPAQPDHAPAYDAHTVAAQTVAA